MSSPQFDTYLCIDWSARRGPSPRRPTADAVWVGRCDLQPKAPDTPPHEQQHYFRTRAACAKTLQTWLTEGVQAAQRILVGFDFSYGYSAGFAAALGLVFPPSPWHQIWAELSHLIQDGPNNANNRFAVAAQLNHRCGPGPGPFWGVPPAQATATLRPTSPGFPYRMAGNALPLPRLRLTEQRLRGVQESWKLLGVGSVGSQALVGIPYVYSLRYHPALVNYSQVWPFETGFGLPPGPGPVIIHSEIWPGVVREAVAMAQAQAPTAIRDRLQVRELCRWLAAADRRGALAAHFARPFGLGDAEIECCLREEGWILGAT